MNLEEFSSIFREISLKNRDTGRRGKTPGDSRQIRESWRPCSYTTHTEVGLTAM